jgi:hypothetical protein
MHNIIDLSAKGVEVFKKAPPEEAKRYMYFKSYLLPDKPNHLEYFFILS